MCRNPSIEYSEEFPFIFEESLDYQKDEFLMYNDINSSYDDKTPFLDFIPTPNNQLFKPIKDQKIRRRDYFIKNIKVQALSKWLISEINLNLKSLYKIRSKMQKPSQTFITECNIIKNRKWLDLTVEQILTKNFNEFYLKKKNPQWEKKQTKNLKIFTLLHKKHEEIFNKDIIFNRTMLQVLTDYVKSDQFLIDKKKKKTTEDSYLFDMYSKGDSSFPNIIKYFLVTPGNKEKDL